MTLWPADIQASRKRKVGDRGNEVGRGQSEASVVERWLDRIQMIQLAVTGVVAKGCKAVD